MNIPIGFVILDRVNAHGHHNLRVYKTEKLALRYSRGTPVVPAYVKMPFYAYRT